MENNNYLSDNYIWSFLSHRDTIKDVFTLNKNNFNNELKPLDELYFICPICYDKCLEKYHPDKCNHCFCKKCIHIWIKYENVCPYFRTKFSYLVHN